jgi:hypothetical protein
MRTTITLTPESAALVTEAMRQHGATFKDVVNDAIVQALAPVQTRPFVQQSRPMGERISLEHTGALLDELDLAEYVLKFGF